MPAYDFINEDTKEIKEIFLGMNEKKVFIDENGVKWRRLFSVPQAAVKDKLPSNEKEFSEYVGKRKGTLGDVWDLSQQLSDRRAEKTNDGVDPVKKEHDETRSKKLKNKKAVREKKSPRLHKN